MTKIRQTEALSAHGRLRHAQSRDPAQSRRPVGSSTCADGPSGTRMPTIKGVIVAAVTGIATEAAEDNSCVLGGITIIVLVATSLTLAAWLPGLAASTSPAIPSPGCGTTDIRRVDHEPGSMVVGGVERSWVLAVPSAHDGLTPLPLVVMLHGLGGSPNEIRFITASDIHEQQGFVVVAPLGSGLISRWMWDPRRHRVRPESIEIRTSPSSKRSSSTSPRHCASTWHGSTRPATPMARSASRPSDACSRIGSRRSPRWRASRTSAPHAIWIGRSRPSPIHGAADPYVLIDGGWGEGASAFILEDLVPFTDQPITRWPGFEESIADRAAGLAARNGCEPEPAIEASGPDAEWTTWACPPGADVELAVLKESGHDWPVTPVDATAVIWDFLSDQALPEPGSA